MIRALIPLILASAAIAQDVGEVVGWKHGHPPGIETRAGKITRWPESLGPVPTDDQVAVWRVEYNIWRDAQDAEEAIDMDPRETARALEDLVATLVEERVIQRAKVPPQILDRINRRRSRRGRGPL